MPGSFDISAAPPSAEGEGGRESPAPDAPQYRVPKLRVKARVRLRGQEPRTILLHLGERAELHAGAERPSDLLCGPRDFLPVEGPEGRVLFLSTHAIDVLTVPAGLEEDPSGGAGEGEPAGTQERPLTLHLDDGGRVTGRVRFLPQPGRGRLLDHLNGPAPFVAVREGEVVHLVNKRRVAWVAADTD